MKIKLFFILILISLKVYGQSVTITPSGDTTSNHPMRVFSGTSQQVLHLRNNNLYGTGLNLSNNGGYSRGGLIGSDNDLTLVHPGGSILIMNKYTPDQFVKLHSNGNFAVGNLETPTAGLHVKEYSKLGENAPAIKMKKITGTTPSSQGSCAFIDMGVSSTKVLNYKVQVEFSGIESAFVPEEYTYNPGYKFSVYTYDNNLVICLHSGNSVNILNKAYKVLLTYEE